MYGLPEVNRRSHQEGARDRKSGVLPDGRAAAFLPLVEAGVIELDNLVADAKSGVSGAGRKAETHILFSESADNFQAYGVAGHRHLPEIRQGLSRVRQCARRSDLRAAPDADDPRHPRHAVRPHQEGMSICRPCSKSALPARRSSM